MAVCTVWVAMAVAGAAAGAGGAMVLGRLPRGVPVPVPVCTVAVAALWAAVGERASEGLPVWWWPSRWFSAGLAFCWQVPT